MSGRDDFSTAKTPKPAATPAATKLSTPLPAPADFTPPPEPSWWPLLAVCFLGTCCLGGSVGAVILGIHQVQRLLAGSYAEAPQAGAPPRPQNVRPPQLQAAPMRPMPQIAPAAPKAAPAEAPNPAKFQNDFREAMRQIEKQLAERFPAIEPPAPEPPAAVLPAPPLGEPEQELPLLEFGPQDVAAIGPVIHGDELFQDVAPAGGWLVGLRVIKGESWGGSILALQPIYQVGGEYRVGQQCGGGIAGIEHLQLLGKPGYAIGKIEARIGLIMNAVRTHFYRVNGQKLDSADAYASDWVGGDGGSLTALDGQGAPLVGVAGSYQPQDELITIQALRIKP